MSKHYRTSLICILLVTFFSCKKTPQTTPTPTPTIPQNKDVYVAGMSFTGSDNTTACYWKNDQVVKLGVAGALSFAYEVAVLNTDVYVIGATQHAGSTFKKAALWKNGTLQVLTNTEGEARSIVVNNNIIYIVGTVKDASGNNEKGFLWTSTSPTATEINSNISAAYDITYNGSEQMIGGSIGNAAALWRNGTPTTFTEGAFSLTSIWSVAFSGSNYYLLGYRANPGNSEYGLWKFANNTQTFTRLTTLGILGFGTKIAAKGDTALIVGQTNTGGLFNTGLTKFNTVTNTHTTVSLINGASQSNDVLVDGTDIYVAIDDFSSVGNNSVLWKNGVLKTLPPSNGFDKAKPFGIYIHKY